MTTLVNWFIAVAVTLGILICVGTVMQGQQTTNTNCTMNGNTANCTSTTTDNAAQQQRAYEAGQQVGNALGMGIAAGIRAHAQKKAIRQFCDTHPGWTLGGTHCLTNDDKALSAAYKFMAHHKDYIPGSANSGVLTAYLSSHKLDPREERSYERAYTDLKKTGQLELYAK